MSGRRFKFVRDYGELFNHWTVGTVIEPMHIGWATTLVQRGILEELPAVTPRLAPGPAHPAAETAAAPPAEHRRRGRPRKGSK